MKSNYKTKYIQLPLAVFASRYPAQYLAMVSHRLIPPDALFDNRYIVRLQLSSSGGFNVEFGYAEDEWIISDEEN